MSGCKAEIDKLDVHFHGGASWLYNLFSSEIADKVKDALNGQICTILSTAISAANSALAKLPRQEPLDKYAGLDFELVEAPITTSSYLLASSKAASLACCQRASE